MESARAANTRSAAERSFEARRIRRVRTATSPRTDRTGSVERQLRATVQWRGWPAATGPPLALPVRAEHFKRGDRRGGDAEEGSHATHRNHARADRPRREGPPAP